MNFSPRTRLAFGIFLCLDGITEFIFSSQVSNATFLHICIALGFFFILSGPIIVANAISDLVAYKSPPTRDMELPEQSESQEPR